MFDPLSLQIVVYLRKRSHNRLSPWLCTEVTCRRSWLVDPVVALGECEQCNRTGPALNQFTRFINRVRP